MNLVDIMKFFALLRTSTATAFCAHARMYSHSTIACVHATAIELLQIKYNCRINNNVNSKIKLLTIISDYAKCERYYAVSKKT